MLPPHVPANAAAMPSCVWCITNSAGKKVAGSEISSAGPYLNSHSANFPFIVYPFLSVLAKCYRSASCSNHTHLCCRGYASPYKGWQGSVALVLWEPPLRLYNRHFCYSGQLSRHLLF